MITAIVLFQMPKGTTRADAEAIFKQVAPNYVGLPGLVRKSFLFGEDGRGGGAYLWESREAAERVYTPAWRKMIAERYGMEPTISYFETPVIVESAAGKITTT